MEIIRKLRRYFHIRFAIVFGVLTLVIFAAALYHIRVNTQIQSLTLKNKTTEQKLSGISKELETLKAQDQVKRNDQLEKEIKNIQRTYKDAVTTYESLLTLEESDSKNKQIPTLQKNLAQSLVYLSEKNYSSASALIATINKTIGEQTKEVSNSFSIPSNVAVNNTPPSSGYSKQQVSTDIGNYLVDIVSGDLGSTRVIVDTASDGTCANDCPVLSLGDYVSRSGAFAGINGSYFCPAAYPTCAGKTNSFDTLLMNKNKVYFNSENNVYSTVPVVVFGNGWVRFIGRSLDWGRDTGVDGVIANQPLLVSGGNVTFGGDGDPKKGSKGARSFVANKGNIVYIGVVHNVTVAEAAIVLKTMGMENALNLDSGGSTALWSGGYKVGPGRNIPNAILFMRK